MEKLKIEELKNILSLQQKWIKVHAAEFLIWENQQVSFVKQIYLNEQKLYGTVPKYRIGIWRVLYQTSISTAEREFYLNKIVTAFQTGVDTLHALETLAKLKQPVTSVIPKFADQIWQAKKITPFEIYGLWNLYYDVNMDKKKIIECLLAVLADPKQSDQNKTMVCYVFRFIEIPRGEQNRILRVDTDSFSRPVQLQFLASLLINFDLRDQEYQLYKRKLLTLTSELDYYAVAIRALAARGKPENAVQIEKYAAMLSDTTSTAYKVDHHSTANYAWLQHHRLARHENRSLNGVCSFSER